MESKSAAGVASVPFFMAQGQLVRPASLVQNIETYEYIFETYPIFEATRKSKRVYKALVDLAMKSVSSETKEFLAEVLKQDPL